jgi:hypothetical protein
MADLTSLSTAVDGGPYFATFNNAGVGIAGSVPGANNFLPQQGNGLGPRTVIVKIQKSAMTSAELNASLAFLTQASGVVGALPDDTADAFTVAGLAPVGNDGQFVSGTTADVYVALQGTGVTTWIKAGLEALTGVTTATVVADFDQRVIPA